VSVSVVRVLLPAHLKTLAGVSGEVGIDVEGVVSAASIVGALEKSYPALRGTIRNPVTEQRRPFVRFFVAGEDISHQPLNEPLPANITLGAEPFIIIGAMAGG
jgi:molybdopterin converting factor small subunit